MGRLTPADKRRRLGIALLVVACAGGLAAAGLRTREVDADGDTIIESGDPCEVTVSGDGGDLPACDPAGADDDAAGDVVEQLFPADGAEALQQVQVGIDLGAAYTGTLYVDGIEVPEEQLVRVEALNQLFFAPGDGQLIEEWRPGRNCVRAIVWPIVEGRSESRDVDWCFEVT